VIKPNDFTPLKRKSWAANRPSGLIPEFRDRSADALIREFIKFPGSDVKKLLS
jgi:hypothetical protein